MIWVIDLSCEIQTVTRCTACRWVKYLCYLGISRYSSWLSLQTYFSWKLSISLIAIIFCVHLVSDLWKGFSVNKYLSMKVKGNTKHFSADCRNTTGIDLFTEFQFLLVELFSRIKKRKIKKKIKSLTWKLWATFWHGRSSYYIFSSV